MKGAGVLTCLGAWVLCLGAVCTWPMAAAAQATSESDRVMTVVRTAMRPALPFPDTDVSGSVPDSGSAGPLWMVRPLEPGERSIEVMANPLNEINQARAARAMAQIGAAIDAAQKRAEQQYDRAIAEAKRTGKSQDVDGVGLSDEGVAGARIDAEAHVTIDVDFNQPAYTVAVESSVAPALSRQVDIVGAVAVVTVPSNTYRARTGQRPEEKFTPGEAIVYFGALASPEVRQRSENAFEVTASAAAQAETPAVRTLSVRFRGNEILIADLLRKTDWNQIVALLK
jgi:hypothetical protein